MAFCRVSFAIAATIASCVLGDPCRGQPPSPLVYTNTVNGYQNRFVIGSADVTSAGRYRLDGNEPIQFDRLTFVRDVEFSDNRNNAPGTVRGWEYEGTDKTSNTWRIIFGKDRNTNGSSYPVYYQFSQGTTFSRWLTPRGTHRVEASFDDQVHAILWANQVDVDRLGLEPFREEDQSAIAVKLAWSSVLPELNELLGRSQSSLGTTLVRRPDGKLLIDLEMRGNSQAILFESLHVRNDLNVVKEQFREMRVVLESELSPNLFTDDALDFPQVASLISRVVRQDLPELAELHLRTNTRFFPDRCEVVSTPWQLIQCGTNHCQYWKLRFGCERFRKNNVEKYNLSLVYDIGECETSDQDRGESFILLRYHSLDASEFSSLQTSVRRTGDEQHPITVRKSIVQNLPNGYSVYDPMQSFDLMATFQQAFRAYVSQMQGK